MCIHICVWFELLQAIHASIQVFSSMNRHVFLWNELSSYKLTSYVIGYRCYALAFNAIDFLKAFTQILHLYFRSFSPPWEFLLCARKALYDGDCFPQMSQNIFSLASSCLTRCFFNEFLSLYHCEHISHWTLGPTTWCSRTCVWNQILSLNDFAQISHMYVCFWWALFIWPCKSCFEAYLKKIGI